MGQTRWLETSADRRWISGRCILGWHGGETYRERGQADFASLHILRRGGLREHAHGARALHPALRSRPERERGPDADASRGHLLLSVLPLVCVCVCGPDDACLTTRAVRVCIPWRATVYERCRLRCSCVCTRLWSAGCEKALRLLMMTSLVGGRGSFIFRGSRSRSRSSDCHPVAAAVHEMQQEQTGGRRALVHTAGPMAVPKV